MYLGIDTSCYTTSLAVVDAQGRLLWEARKLLPVPAGERGLRQSDGLFLHVQNLPDLMAEIVAKSGLLALRAIAASSSPRPVAGSYMPVFSAGVSFARALATVLGVPYHTCSHQEGHVRAGMWSAGVSWDDFYVLHVSGGTTELLQIKMAETPQIEEIGGSADLHAGQFIDRVGVALGLPFPAGPHLEALAQTAEETMEGIPVSVQGLQISFSGPESHVQRLLTHYHPQTAAIARGVERCVAESLVRLLAVAMQRYGSKPVLFVGGVMANKFICQYLKERAEVTFVFATPHFAGDNAVGVALMAANINNS